jgi:mannose-6-phosphate isomerase-like protein (cupin superfamily)
MQPFSKDNCIKHYQWGEGGHGWVFVDTPGLSVKQELMPAHTSETLHYHKQSQQFFFILKGTATFEVDGETTEVQQGSGFHIEAGKKHNISNDTNEDLEFILSSQPSTNGDRHAG